MTDPKRRPDPAVDAARLTVGQGIVLRHYGVPERRMLAGALAKIARAKRLRLLIAADWRLAAEVGADGVHLPQGLLMSGRLAPLLGWARRRGAIVTCACHDRPALAVASRLGMAAGLVSPVFPTRSHPGAKTLGLIGLARMARSAPISVIALGGMTDERARHAKRRGSGGWASANPPLSA